MRRFLSCFLIFVFVFVLIFADITPVYACNEEQSERYVAEIIFGDDAAIRQTDDKTKMLMSALYLCSEQSDKQGQDHINYLKKKNVSKVSSINKINVPNTELIACSHIGWDFEYTTDKKIRNNRKKILTNTVKKVFDFKAFDHKNEKINSMAALLYYLHILSDYLGNNPEDTEVIYKGNTIPSYVGQPYIEINGGIPSFSASQKESLDTYSEYSELDNYGRCGIAIAVLSMENMPPADSRQNIGSIKPTGWNQVKYPGIVNSDPAYIYNRCHLIAHQLDGNDSENNLITGTRYLNETGMKPFEDKVAKYIRETGNHVIYRATPVFEGDNMLASGVQLEAYSIEDSGKEICFNVYCYNAQPGIEINYMSGSNELNDVISDSSSAIPFAVSNPSDDNPDLIYEINKHLKVLFGDKKGTNSSNYTSMTNEIELIANEARNIGNINEKPAQIYMKTKECEYKYFQTLKTYVPKLLKNEDFFKSAYK